MRDLFQQQTPRAPAVLPPSAPTARINVVGVIDLLGRAKANGLKYPKLRLQLPDGTKVQVAIAGERSRTPGFVMLTDGGKYPDNLYFGRISPAGQLDIGRDGHTRADALVQLLVRLSFNPAKVAADYGHLTGHCCFCRLQLNDARSTTVGYGPICAEKYALPWGAHAIPDGEE